MNAEEIAKEANKANVHINVIQFGSGPGGGAMQNVLKELAKRTKGDYRYIDVSSLSML